MMNHHSTAVGCWIYNRKPNRSRNVRIVGIGRDLSVTLYFIISHFQSAIIIGNVKIYGHLCFDGHVDRSRPVPTGVHNYSLFQRIIIPPPWVVGYIIVNYEYHFSIDSIYSAFSLYFNPLPSINLHFLFHPTNIQLIIYYFCLLAK